MKKNTFLNLLLGISLTFLASCAGETEKITINSPELRLSAEGPLFEGANTATASWEFDLSALIGKTEEDLTAVKNAKLTQVEISLEDGEGLPGIEKMVFEMTSKNTPMTRLGLYQGKIDPGKSFVLNLADKQEKLASAFEDGKITFVGDFDLLEEEYWEDIHFSLKATFELEIKK
ncbi:hypothetical protein [Cecembia lonarensis]|uniref:Lipid/polyisoprenoid-binding YceI-like domain-containing protein n=1 Tax=Cecembia lonarensis (strain CCUG 58316 / KCTC 22772 / LW9) TaxID=1225176 RepID=K1LEY8_CECL9|nr:hypothetical protein [Cecembia lonarensis]EKB48943.1 hypothetical protein B879_02432 [Cecembia lonarensis LW9]